MNPYEIATRIERRAAWLRKEGKAFPSIDEFVILYGVDATEADCNDYLSSFETPHYGQEG